MEDSTAMRWWRSIGYDPCKNIIIFQFVVINWLYGLQRSEENLLSIAASQYSSLSRRLQN